MRTITVNGNEYVLEYSFEAAENQECVQAMFQMVSGAYVIKRAPQVEDGDEVSATTAMLDGVAEMVSVIPHVATIAFYAGLLEHNPMSKDDAKALMRAYMKENKISYNKIYEEIKTCMEDDGFFDLSGLTEMLQTMEKSAEDKVREIKSAQKKTATKKSTSTK